MADPIHSRVSDCRQAYRVHRATIYRSANRGWINIYKRSNCNFVSVVEMRASIESH